MLDLRRFVGLRSYLASNSRVARGATRVFVREGVKELLNFQDVKGKAKPYQVRQFIKLIEKYSLLER
jgi:hypothetical protein